MISFISSVLSNVSYKVQFFSTFALFCFVFVFLRSDLKHLQIVFQHDGNNLSTIAKFLSSSY